MLSCLWPEFVGTSDICCNVFQLIDLLRQNRSTWSEQPGNLVVIDYRELKTRWPRIGEMLSERPEETLASLGCAFVEMGGRNVEVVTKVQVAISNYDRLVQFKDLKANLIGTFVQIKASAVRVGAVKPMLRQISFRCVKCLQSMVTVAADGVYKVPARCQTHHCSSKAFVPERESANTICHNWQRIKVQEILDDDEMEESGRVPRTVECELADGLVDLVAPGDSLLLCGILKTADIPEGKAQIGATYSCYLDVNYCTKMRGESVRETASLERMNAVAQTKDFVRLLIKSFCPTIYGNELVKFGLLLTMFGGSRRDDSSRQSTFSIRAEPHVLLVGDPGLGKSQLITAASQVGPRGIYVCGNTSTAAGLTATIVHEGGSGEYSLEAGALVLADQGCCCIDEFDKISEHRVLLDVMEQQMVNVAKAGVVCSLPARTSVIAAANPAGGHYNRRKTVVENVKMDSALLSRFDLVFILLDRPNSELDRLLSDHVLASFSRPRSTQSSLPIHQFAAASQTQTPNHQPSNLLQRIQADSTVASFPPSALRSFILQARHRVAPRMTMEAAEPVQKFYLDLRQGAVETDDLLPITTRHLESMIRLCEARAKMEMRPTVTKEDAQDIIDLMYG